MFTGAQAVLVGSERISNLSDPAWHRVRSACQRVCYDGFYMAIPNVKRFRPFCPTCNESYTLMAVLPKEANVDAFLADAVARHDHKAFNDAKAQQSKVRVGQQKQKKAK